MSHFPGDFRPQEIDEAARRRFVKRLYIPLPELEARKQIVWNLMSQQKHQLSVEHVEDIGWKTDGGYSKCGDQEGGLLNQFPLLGNFYHFSTSLKHQLLIGYHDNIWLVS